MGTASAHSGSKGCESRQTRQTRHSSQTSQSSEPFWNTPPSNHRLILRLSCGIGLSQVTVNAAHQTQNQCTICTMYDGRGTSSAVHTSTGARVPLDASHSSHTFQLDIDGGAQSGESYSHTLSHSLHTRCTLAADLCIIVPGSVGEVPALVRY